jgi:hypothetical protein
VSVFPEHSGPPAWQARPIGPVRAANRVLAYLRLAVLLRRRVH